jgi:outer membrane receptor protein involved in Fe transport
MLLDGRWTLFIACVLFTPLVDGAEPDQLGVINVTGTAPRQDAQAVSVITGDELRARGITDLSGALQLIAGVMPARGGDAGPAGTIPGLLGSREVDDYLLVVDGVPLGSTVVPPFETVDLSDVDRIEVTRGPDPIIYGTAAFAGTIQIFHYPAGQAAQTAGAYAGSYGSKGLDASIALPDLDSIRQSVSAAASQLRYSDPRAKADRYQLLYRASVDAGDGVLKLDANLLDLQQVPLSPTPVSDNGLANDVPLDTNQNPAGARSNEYRSQLALNYTAPLAGWDWQTTASLSHLTNPVEQGFLVDGYDEPGTDPNAEGFRQDKRLTEAFFDTHLSQSFGNSLGLTFGFNDAYSNGNAASMVFGYAASLDGAAPSATMLDDDDDGSSYARDLRNYGGIYAQSRWRLGGGLSLNLGLRENLTNEDRYTFDDDDGPSTSTYRSTELSKSAELRRQSLDTPGYSFTPYIKYTNGYQPPQFDFSPDPDDAVLLQPETVRGWQLGAGGNAGTLDWEVSIIVVNFANGVIAQDVGGLPGFVNGGNDAYRDLDAELDFRISDSLRLMLSGDYNDARYENFLTQGDSGNVQLSGNRLPLTPRMAAALGITYGDTAGFNAAFSVHYTGSRFLDEFNKVLAPAFATFDGKLGYGFGPWSVYLTATNLSDRRDPVAASELGDGQVYRLFGRNFEIGVTRSL